MNKQNKSSQSGMMALFPAIIISGILIAISVSLSLSFLSFLYRATVLEQKIQADILAHSCAFRVKAKHIQNNDYVGDNEIIQNNYCTIKQLSVTSGKVTLKFGEAISSEVVNY